MDTTIIPALRLQNTSEYYFANKLKQVAQMNNHGKKVINLGIGNPNLPPSEETISAIIEEVKQPQNHGYQPHHGIDVLRESFGHFYEQIYGVHVNPQTEIQPLMGSKQGILYVTLALLNPGDKVLIPNPGYPAYQAISRMLGVEVVHFDLKENIQWQPNFEEIEERGLQGVKLMWLNYPNMPTGARGSRAVFEQAVAFGRKHNIVIAHDNPYSLILNDNPQSIMQIDGAREIAIELNSMSKSHNMAGWRMAMVTSNKQIISWIRTIISNIESGMFRPLQVAASKALHNSLEWHTHNNIEVYASRRFWAEKIMAQLGCKIDLDSTGMFLWGKIPDNIESGEMLVETLLQKANVFVAPGFIFGSNGNRYIRISLCADEEDMKEALNRIREIKL